MSSHQYKTTYADSISNPDKFWAEIGRSVAWTKPWTGVLNNSNPPFTKWFEGGELNACYNAVDRHVEAGAGPKTALIYENPRLQTTERITYSQLQQHVAKLAGALALLGVRLGDRVIIYFPPMPEACIAMLACARLGAIHSFMFGGFSAGELAHRIQHCRPKAILAANCAIEHTKTVNYMDNLVQALRLTTHKPTKCIILQRKQILVSSFGKSSMFVDWEKVVKKAAPHPCVSVDSNHPLYILYTSGTTGGQPKGVLRPTGGHLVSLAWSMQTLYGMRKEDVWWTTSDFGWVVGHSYMCYAPLLCGMTTIIYEGKPATTPDAWQYFRLMEKHKVNGFFTIPTILRILRKNLNAPGVQNRYDLSALRHIFVAGEHCDLTTKLWTERFFQVPVLNHWWQTETGHAITANCVGLGSLEQQGLSTGLPYPGFKLEVRSKDGGPCQVGELGRILVKLPLPPGAFIGLYCSKDKFQEHYFRQYPGYYDTKDAGYMDEEGNVFVTSRDDDIINVAGHRISTLSLENIILSHLEITDACVISVPDPIKNEMPFCFYVLKRDDADEDLISEELVEMVRAAVGPVASFKLAASIRALPQTRSGKICRKLMADMARNNNAKVHTMVTDPSIFDDVRMIFQKVLPKPEFLSNLTTPAL